MWQFITEAELEKIEIVNGIETHECREIDDPIIIEWISAGNVPAPYKTPTLAQVKAEQIHLINQSADAAFAVITSPYPKQEPDGWPNQYAEAWALQSDPNAYCPTLTAISIAAEINVSALATSVLQKAAVYNQAYGSIVGKRKKLTDQVNAATTPEEAKAWTW